MLPFLAYFSKFWPRYYSYWPLLDLFLKALEPKGVENAGFYIFDLVLLLSNVSNMGFWLAPFSELTYSSEENGTPSNCSNFMFDGSLSTFML